MADPGRLLQAFAAMVREVFPNVDFLGVYLYEVFSWNDGAQTADLRPVGNSKMPQLTGVPPRLPGLQVKLMPGDQVLVGFQDGNSSQPFIAQLSTAANYSVALPIAQQGSMTLSGGTGTAVMFIELTPPTPPGPKPMTTLQPYLVSFGTVLVPPIPLPQGMLPGIVSTGSVRSKTV